MNRNDADRPTGKYAASIADKDLLKTEILEMCMSLAKDDQVFVLYVGGVTPFETKHLLSGLRETAGS